MQALEVWKKFLSPAEGKDKEHPNDKGGATYRGFTLTFWKEIATVLGFDSSLNGLRNMTENQWQTAVNYFWQLCKADKIKNTSKAVMFADYCFHSGISGGTKKVQEMLNTINPFFNLAVDGKAGPKTLSAINIVPSVVFVPMLYVQRYNFLKSLIKKDASQAVFSNGWDNRLKNLFTAILPYFMVTIGVTVFFCSEFIKYIKM